MDEFHLRAKIKQHVDTYAEGQFNDIIKNVKLYKILNVNKMFGKSKNSRTFAFNNTCHASHKNSAPGQVFAFYRLLVSNSLNSKAYVVQ